MNIAKLENGASFDLRAKVSVAMAERLCYDEDIQISRTERIMMEGDFP